MPRSRRFFAPSPWIATGTPDYVNLGYTSRGLAKQALMRLSRKSLAIFRKLGLAAKLSEEGQSYPDRLNLEAAFKYTVNRDLAVSTVPQILANAGWKHSKWGAGY